MVKPPMLSILRVRDVMTKAILLLRAEMSVDEAWEHLHPGGATGVPDLERGRYFDA
jgi:hypothetical protein